MEYTVARLAKLAGITPRTLHHYHQIGLLAPKRISSSGYRIYGTAQVDRLQQILFYRELGMELGEIKSILDDPAYQPEKALQNHLQTLTARRNQLNRLIDTANRTLCYLKGKCDMSDTEKFEGFKSQLIAENEETYGKEIREKYGDEAVETSKEKMMNMTKEQYDAYQALGDKLADTLRRAVEAGDPAAPLAQEAAALHKEWLCFTWPAYNPEAHRNLAHMYVDDPRFTQYYEQVVPGGAVFLRDTVDIFTQQQPQLCSQK